MFVSLFCLPPTQFLDGSPFHKPGPGQGFSVKREFFLATVLTWGFRLQVSASVKHLGTILIVKGARKLEMDMT